MGRRLVEKVCVVVDKPARLICYAFLVVMPRIPLALDSSTLFHPKTFTHFSFSHGTQVHEHCLLRLLHVLPSEPHRYSWPLI